VDGVTGLFFRDQTPEALIDALRRFEVTCFRPEKIRAHALRFGEARFRAEMRAFVDECLAGHREGRPAC
jgi:hypothetical protein